jgi:hypothetical protein
VSHERGRTQALNQAIKAHIDLDNVTGEALASFEDLQCINPRCVCVCLRAPASGHRVTRARGVTALPTRGRYEVDFFSDFLRLRGKVRCAMSRPLLPPSDH